MTVKAGWSTPLLHVADVRRSLRFYGLLGFETIDVELDGETVVWGRAHCEGGALMFLLSDEEEHPVPQDSHDRILFYLYTPDLPALQTQLESGGVQTGPISHPIHMRSGELCLSDPDGYVVLIGQWGDKEHAEWESSRQAKREAGLIP